MIKNITAVILAGGNSSRMNFDKKYIEVNEEYLMNKNVKILLKYFENVVIISNDLKLDEFELPLNIKIYKDDIRGCGPLGGIYTAIKNINTEYIYVLACDMPNVNVNYINYLSNIANKFNVDGVVTQFGDWIEPFNAIYSRKLLKSMKGYLVSGRKSIFGFIENKEFYYVAEKIAREFSPNWEMFENYNTELDLLKNINL